MKPVISNELFFAEVERLLSEEGRVVLTVQGNSMRPFVRSGRTRAVLALCDPSQLTKGDEVLFRSLGRHILHRIISVDGDELLLSGDGNYRIFERCRREDVVARVEAFVSRKGRVTECGSGRWRRASALWLWLHPFLRRCILSALRRLRIL